MYFFVTFYPWTVEFRYFEMLVQTELNKDSWFLKVKKLDDNCECLLNEYFILFSYYN